MTTIIGIKVSNRIENALFVQQILTNYGCFIKTRIGLHSQCNGQCSPDGLVLLEITDDQKAEDIAQALCEIEEIEIQQMKFA